MSQSSPETNPGNSKPPSAISKWNRIGLALVSSLSAFVSYYFFARSTILEVSSGNAGPEFFYLLTIYCGFVTIVGFLAGFVLSEIVKASKLKSTLFTNYLLYSIAVILGVAVSWLSWSIPRWI